VENRFVGIKSRGVYECPGGQLLREAHLDIEGLTLDREVKRMTENLGLEFSKFCYQGFWFAPEMNLVRHAMDYAQKDVDGFVDMELYKGNIFVVGRDSDKTLYSADLASMDIEDAGER
jgi:argininosuccinate synthase